jgi:hypothetical protein
VSNAATSSVVIELPPITIVEDADGNEVVRASSMVMATTNAQAEMQIDLGEAQRLSDATVHEWFATRRAAKDGSLVEEVDKRLVMMLARKKLADTQPALVKTCIADAIAQAISFTLYK